MKFKVGDRVYCSIYKRYGIIVDIKLHSNYPIRVNFLSNKNYPYNINEGYTIDGRILINNNFKSLSHSLSHSLKLKINKLLEL